MKHTASKPKNVSRHAWRKHLKLNAKLRSLGIIK